MKTQLSILFCTWALSASALVAHPTTFEGGTSIMSFNTHSMNEIWAHYSFTHRFCLGVRFTHLKEEGSETSSVMGTSSFLVHRWNHPKFQANLYAFGGAGAHFANNQKGRAFHYGGEVDIEDRRLYFLSSWGQYRFENFRDPQILKARFGFAPYLAEFDELATWMIVQYEFKPDAEEEHVITPMMRFFYRNGLIEIGSSLEGEWMINLMTHF